MEQSNNQLKYIQFISEHNTQNKITNKIYKRTNIFLNQKQNCIDKKYNNSIHIDKYLISKNKKTFLINQHYKNSLLIKYLLCKSANKILCNKKNQQNQNAKKSVHQINNQGFKHNDKFMPGNARKIHSESFNEFKKNYKATKLGLKNIQKIKLSLNGQKISQSISRAKQKQEFQYQTDQKIQSHFNITHNQLPKNLIKNKSVLRRKKQFENKIIMQPWKTDHSHFQDMFGL